MIWVLLDDNGKMPPKAYRSGNMTNSSISDQAALLEEQYKPCETSHCKAIEDDGKLTVATMIMKSSQPKTRFMTTRTYNRIRTNTKGTIAIVHITPCKSGALLA